MDAGARNELYAIRDELSSIIAELNDISAGVRRDFRGIGNERCAECIDRVIEQYRVVARKLNNMDTKTVTASFEKAHGGGGGGGRGW